MHSNGHGVILVIRYVGEDFNRGIFGRGRSFTHLQLVAELSTLGVLLSALSILFSIILSALRPVHHNNTFL